MILQMLVTVGEQLERVREALGAFRRGEAGRAPPHSSSSRSSRSSSSSSSSSSSRMADISGFMEEWCLFGEAFVAVDAEQLCCFLWRVCLFTFFVSVSLSLLSPAAVSLPLFAVVVAAAVAAAAVVADGAVAVAVAVVAGVAAVVAAAVVAAVAVAAAVDAAAAVAVAAALCALSSGVSVCCSCLHLPFTSTYRLICLFCVCLLLLLLLLLLLQHRERLQRRRQRLLSERRSSLHAFLSLSPSAEELQRGGWGFLLQERDNEDRPSDSDESDA